eukprot:scaffold141076_cov42-Prasinocladus_malaysianus.AAC.1
MAAETAAGALCNLAVNADNRVFISSARGIPSLVAMVRSNGPGAREAAAKVVRSARPFFRCQQIVIFCRRAGLNHSRQSSPLADQKFQSEHRVLWNLAVNDDSKTAIARAGGIPALIALLEQSNSGAKEAAAGALCNLALNADYKVEIASSGAIPPLLRMLSCSEPSLAEAAAKALWRLAEAEENAAPIVWSGGLIQLLQVIGPERVSPLISSATCEAAIRALAYLARSQDAASAIVRTGKLSLSYTPG